MKETYRPNMKENTRFVSGLQSGDDNSRFGIWEHCDDSIVDSIGYPASELCPVEEASVNLATAVHCKPSLNLNVINNWVDLGIYLRNADRVAAIDTWCRLEKNEITELVESVLEAARAYRRAGRFCPKAIQDCLIHQLNYIDIVPNAVTQSDFVSDKCPKRHQLLSTRHSRVKSDRKDSFTEGFEKFSVELYKNISSYSAQVSELLRNRIFRFRGTFGRCLQMQSLLWFLSFVVYAGSVPLERYNK